MRLSSIILAAAIAAPACGSDSDDPEIPAQPSRDDTRDILTTSLSVDVAAKQATAVIELARSDSSGASFEIGDLSIGSVSSDLGDLPFSIEGARLDVGVPADFDLAIEIQYAFESHEAFDGATSNGLTFLWPYFCGNLYPCKSDPSDGLRFALELSNPGAGRAIFPAEISADAPSYMIAWAVGDYQYIDLGATSAGTKVGVWHLPGSQVTASSGTVNLTGAFEWLETTLGPYPFGGEVASVEAPWGPGAFGGMEHHPFWHVSRDSMSDEETHVHEAAHGWFGNGVRIACWEDFTLSEGTVTYLAARAIAEVGGPLAGDAIWASYQSELSAVSAEIAWPEGCGDIDILEDGLYTNAPYVKGAFFYRGVELQVGAPTLDAAIASFYAANVGAAATMQDMLDHIASETGYDPQACALAWLRSDTVPAETTCP